MICNLTMWIGCGTIGNTSWTPFRDENMNSEEPMEVKTMREGGGGDEVASFLGSEYALFVQLRMHLKWTWFKPDATLWQAMHNKNKILTPRLSEGVI